MVEHALVTNTEYLKVAAMDVLDAAGNRMDQNRDGLQGDGYSGSFQIADGRAQTQDLRLVYQDYQVDLTGVLGLLDRSLDFRGKLTLFEDVDRALANGARGVKHELPLAAVKGTLDDPKVSISPQVALSFAASVYGSGERREKLERKIDERLGEGGGKQVLDLLDSVLGGGSRRKQEEPP